MDVSGLTTPATWLIDLFGGGQTYSGETVTSETAILNSNVYTCVSILGADIAKLPIQVFKRKGDSIQKDTEHPVSFLLGMRPNPYMSAYTFKELMQVHVGIWGNAYANIEWDSSGTPIALWPLDPSQTYVTVDSKGNVWYITTLPDGEQRKLYPNEVLHIKNISKNGLMGMSPIEVVREEIGIQQASKKFIGAFYSNGTATRGVLKTPAVLKQEAKQKLREEWENLNTGLTNAHRIAILDAGLDYQSIGMNLADAQFIETAKFGILEIAKIYKIPPHKLGQLDRATFSNIENQSLEYVKNTLLPICKNWEEEINYKLFTQREQRKYYVKFNMTAELRGDSASRANFYKEMIMAGVMSINEVRALEEMDNIGELGDKHYMQLDHATLENLEKYQQAKIGLKGGETSASN